MRRKATAIGPTLVVGLALCALPHAASAASVCSGTISGSPLRPIAQPVVVSMAHRIDSTSNPELAQQFVTGLQGAGLSVVPPGQGTTTLDLSFMLKGRHAGSYRDLSWMRGATPSGPVKSSLLGSHLDLTIYGRDAASRSLVWTGVISCTVQTNDMDALAQGLGATVGQYLGKSVPKANL